ncbi:hypothetical protein ACFE04_006407 [Oxalis oulophora]
MSFILVIGGFSKLHRIDVAKLYSSEYFRPARLSLKGGFLVQASAAGSDVYLNSEGSVDRNSGVAVSTYNGVDPFRGKAGLITFSGLTYEKVEEAKLESAPFEVDRGSFLWPLAPVALLASLIIPQIFLGNAFTGFFGGRGILLELLVTISYDVVFYIGLAIFLSITNQVQKPYLEYSSKRWGLITGLRGYLTSAFFTMGIKVIVPLFAIYVAWPMLGLQSLVALFPFLAGCAAQFAFESFLDKNGSSCWPIVPIIFEGLLPINEMISMRNDSLFLVGVLLWRFREILGLKGPSVATEVESNGTKLLLTKTHSLLLSTDQRSKLIILPINELTYRAILAMDGMVDFEELIARENGKVFRCSQSDGEVLCGSPIELMLLVVMGRPSKEDQGKSMMITARREITEKALLMPFALATYRLTEKLWKKPETSDEEVITAKENAAFFLVELSEV